jgi:hypothetical protein
MSDREPSKNSQPPQAHKARAHQSRTHEHHGHAAQRHLGGVHLEGHQDAGGHLQPPVAVFFQKAVEDDRGAGLAHPLRDDAAPQMVQHRKQHEAANGADEHQAEGEKIAIGEGLDL